MCIHERVMAESDREAVDSACRSLTASWVVEQVCTGRDGVCLLSRLSIFHLLIASCLFLSLVFKKARSNPGSIETCDYFDNFKSAGEATTIPSGVFDLDQLKKLGQERGWCPYFLTRDAINHANILVFNYQYMLDPKVAKMVSKELEAESIIVFDEVRR